MTPVVFNTGELSRVLGRLAHDQGGIARRNARAAVIKALHKIRAKLDKHFPTITTARRRAKPRKAAAVLRRKKLSFRERDFVPVVVESLVGGCALAGIRLEKLPGGGGPYYAPRWVVAVAERIAQQTRGVLVPDSFVGALRRAKRSQIERKALAAAHRLQSQVAP